jgi:hypothetical protein
VSRADTLVVKIAEDGGAFTTVITTNGGSYTNAAFGDFAITSLSASSNTPGTKLIADLLSTNLSVVNNGAGTHTLHIQWSDIGFTAPGSSGSTLAVLSHIGGTVFVGAKDGSLKFQSYADNSNTLFGFGDFTTGVQGPISLASAGSYDSDAAGNFLRSSGTYSLSGTADITLGSGGSINFTTSETLTAVPAPAALVLALTGLPCLGAGYLARRRKNRLEVVA